MHKMEKIQKPKGKYADRIFSSSKKETVPQLETDPKVKGCFKNGMKIQVVGPVKQHRISPLLRQPLLVIT